MIPGLTNAIRTAQRGTQDLRRLSMAGHDPVQLAPGEYQVGKFLFFASNGYWRALDNSKPNFKRGYQVGTLLCALKEAAPA